VCHEGKKVGNSQVALLAKMNIKPFAFGMKVIGCYDDGGVLDEKIVSMNADEIVSTF